MDRIKLTAFGYTRTSWSTSVRFLWDLATFVVPSGWVGWNCRPCDGNGMFGQVYAFLRCNPQCTKESNPTWFWHQQWALHKIQSKKKTAVEVQNEKSCYICFLSYWGDYLVYRQVSETLWIKDNRFQLEKIISKNFVKWYFFLHWDNQLATSILSESLTILCVKGSFPKSHRTMHAHIEDLEFSLILLSWVALTI